MSRILFENDFSFENDFTGQSFSGWGQDIQMENGLSLELSLENYSCPVISPEIIDSCAWVVSLCRGLSSVRYRHSPVLTFQYRVKIMLNRSLLNTEA